MSEENNKKTKKYVIKYNYEDSFISDVKNVSYSYSYADVENQKNAIKNLMKYIRIEKEKGASFEEVRDKVFCNMLYLVKSIKRPTLKDFFQARTIECIKGTDITPYLEEIIKSKIDVKEYVKSNWNGYSADVNKNIKIELCGLISELGDRKERTSNKDFIDICDKIENNSLEMSDIKALKKYTLAIIKELQMGVYTYWEKQKKDIERCRKIMYRYKDSIFDVEKFEYKIFKKEDSTNKAQLSQQEMDKIIENINNNLDKEVNCINNVDALDIFQESGNKVGVRKPDIFPFLGNFDEENIILIMTYALLNSFEEKSIANVYEYLCASEFVPECRLVMHDIINNIRVTRSIFNENEFLKDRISYLVNFFYVTGNLEQYCNVNNETLTRMGLEKFEVTAEEIYKKFVNNPSGESQYFYSSEDEENTIKRCSELDSMSDEAIVAMSALYSNRMAKCIPKYTILEYILCRKDALQRIYDDPNLEYEDLGFSDEEIITYMAMYKVLQDKMKESYFKRDSDGNVKFVDNSYEEIARKLKKYEGVYNNYFKDMEFDLESDILGVMMSIKLIDDMYKLKVFSIKSLLYTAIVDKNKNVINWGYVQQDEYKDPKNVLLAFDVKTLNMPVFVHLKRKQTIEYLKELTGDTVIPIYEGAMDMYDYSAHQWVSTNISYPLSKEPRKLMKDPNKEKQQIKPSARITPLYQHMKWLQQPNKRPSYLAEPGKRLYDMEKGKVVKQKNVHNDNKGQNR